MTHEKRLETVLEFSCPCGDPFKIDTFQTSLSSVGVLLSIHHVGFTLSVVDVANTKDAAACAQNLLESASQFLDSLIGLNPSGITSKCSLKRWV